MSQSAGSTGKFAAFIEAQRTEATAAAERNARVNARLMACLRRTKSSISGEMPALSIDPPAEAPPSQDLASRKRTG